MNEVKVGKLPILYIAASYTCNFVSKLFQGGKNMVALSSVVHKLH